MILSFSLFVYEFIFVDLVRFDESVWFDFFQIINDRETDRSRRFGFITFKDEKSMRDVIEGMNGHDLDGWNITINEA